MNANLPDLIVQEHEGFRVVRGDLFPGGIKSKCLASLLKEVNEEEIVYAAHAYGHSGLALGLAGIYNRKKVTLFGPKSAPTFLTKQRPLTTLPAS